MGKVYYRIQLFTFLAFNLFINGDAISNCHALRPVYVDVS